MVFGYTIANDVSARTTEWGVERDPDVWNDFFDWLCGKWPDGFAPLGPYVLTADEVPDPQALDLSLYLNGERKQQLEHARDDLHRGRDDRVRIALHDARAGRHHRDGHAVGRRARPPGTYVKSGDVMEARIEKLGTLRTPVE